MFYLITKERLYTEKLMANCDDNNIVVYMINTKIYKRLANKISLNRSTIKIDFIDNNRQIEVTIRTCSNDYNNQNFNTLGRYFLTRVIPA